MDLNSFDERKLESKQKQQKRTEKVYRPAYPASVRCSPLVSPVRLST